MAEKSIEQKLQRVEDFQYIQNMMGRYAYYVMAGMQEEMDRDMFAKKQPDFRLYLGEQGYWEGPDARQRAFSGGSPLSEEERQKRRVGNLVMHNPVCPVIEVAGDGKTAKGVWIGIGLLGVKNRETGELEGIWEWDKYGVDFIKEDGEWKIWHHHIYRLLHGWNVDGKWIDQFSAEEPFKAPTPDGPAIDDNPYTPDTVQRMVPKPPEPYETWDETVSY